MGKIKLNFRRLVVTDKIARARQVIAALRDNPAFANPMPALSVIARAIDDLETTHTETLAIRQAAKTNTSARNQREDALDRLMTQLAAYVESVGGANEELIRSAGMDTRAPANSSTGKPTRPSSLAAIDGVHEGEVHLSWDTVAAARSYVIEKSPDPPTATSWTHAGVSIKSRYTINSLTYGSRFWFRVAAVGTAGQSGWSDPATSLVS